MGDLAIIKKFYRDFDSAEMDALSELLGKLRKKYLEPPGYIIERMIDRGLIPKEETEKLFGDKGQLVAENLYLVVDALKPVHETFMTGIVFEVSNEGAKNSPTNPYRLVLAKEINDKVYFIKVSANPPGNKVRLLDIWTKKGKMPLSPPAHSVMQLNRHWNLATAFKGN